MKSDVVLLPSFSQVDQWRARHAGSCAQGLFAQVVTTFAAWIADLWELCGDGRAIVGPLQRQVLMQAAFDQLSDSAGKLAWPGCRAEGKGGNAGGGAGSAGVLTVSKGVVKAACACARDASGTPALEQALESVQAGAVPEGLTERESAFLLGIARYRALLSQAGCVELGQAAARLASESQSVFAHPLTVDVRNAGPLDWVMRAFFESCPQLKVCGQTEAGLSGVGRMPQGVQLGFGFPSGRYAQAALVADRIRSVLDAGAPQREAEQGSPSRPFTFVVACKDPLSLYEQLEEAMLSAGVGISVQAQVAFGATDFGKRFLALWRALHDRPGSKEDVSDATAPPFSGFGRAQALSIDASLRADRIARLEDVLCSLRALSLEFSQLEELASDPEADVLLGAFEQLAQAAPGKSAAWRCLQLAAMGALRSCTAAARAIGADMAAVVGAVEDATVAFSCESVAGQGDQGETRLVVTTQAVAADMGAGSCEELVLCDMTLDDYPVAEREEAAGVLLGKLGLVPCDSAMARARRTFSALQALPSSRMTCVRPLNDWDGNPSYPSAMLQELVDAYRDDPSSSHDVDKRTGIPEALGEGSIERGEELLVSNATAQAAGLTPGSGCRVSQKDIGFVAECNVPKVALPRFQRGGEPPLGFCPSPSQVESYLSCPHKWFAQSRLRLEALDEGFGALERGSFAHACLQEFYRAFAQKGFAKVSPENLGEARKLMSSVCDAVEAQQHELEPRSGRYVAADQLEQRQLDACKASLVGYLDFEARLLPGFRPLHLEYAISPQDGASYGGAPFMGTVDRIDVDDAGNAVVIDYKGSLNPSHEIARKELADPGKVQARMYAQVVRRKLGLNVVGALYVGYGARPACSGAYDGLVLEAAHLPGMKHDNCRLGAGVPRDCIPDVLGGEGGFSELSFVQVLDATESVVAGVIGKMKAADVLARPSSPDACTFCPVVSCPKRGV